MTSFLHLRESLFKKKTCPFTIALYQFLDYMGFKKYSKLNHEYGTSLFFFLAATATFFLNPTSYNCTVKRSLLSKDTWKDIGQKCLEDKNLKSIYNESFFYNHCENPITNLREKANIALDNKDSKKWLLEKSRSFSRT